MLAILAGSSVNVTVSSGNYSVDALNSPGAINLTNTDNSAGNGGIYIRGPIASGASTISITSGNLGYIQVSNPIVSGGTLTTTAGNGITLTGGTGGVSDCGSSVN